MLPAIQLHENSEKVTVYWDLLPGAKKFKIYWSPTGALGTFSLLQGNIPNFGSFGKKATGFSFSRSLIGLTEGDTFYLAITAVDSLDVESDKGVPRLIPYLADQPADGGAVNSPITVSENLSTHVASSVASRIKFTHDVVFMEVFNKSNADRSSVLFVDITGVDATAEKSMPVYPLVYYTVFRNLSKDNGVSLITDRDVADVRIVVHYS